jgi:putative transposase
MKKRKNHSPDFKARVALEAIGKWLAYYNVERPHSTHGILTPDEAYASKIEPMRLAA